MDPDKYRKQIELEILDIIEEKLKSREMDADRARSIARKVLDSLHPPMSIEQIRIAVDKLDDTFPELSPVTLKVSAEEEESIKSAVLDKVTELVKQGKLDEAGSLLKDK